ncbi:uncharacterized protein LOC113321289 isoform X1 [Papaver somniferum]|uniref:uncharacterized protein LOC113321289 isoform X1 n=1 Tax=Papaver somniferum TaxID=3469 RepID=UPI000E704E00|nr:uncharacterized protein LOC113321289 isoform X1 [Papaver somniferum]
MDSQEMMKTIEPQEIHLVSTTTDDSEEYNLLLWALNHSSIVGLDAEWACSNETIKYTFPTVALLQIACRINDEYLEDGDSPNKILVFLVDLQEIIRLSSTLTSIYQLLKDLFVSPHVLKLGFSFKQDFTYLSSTFASHGCPPGFDKLAPFVDISTLYHEGQLQQKQPGEDVSKNLKGLATVCKEVIGVTLSKELQCSDWSFRPLTEDQKTYAAVDAQCLLEIFDVFEEKVLIEESSNFNASCIKTAPPRISLLNIIGRYGERIFLKHFDRKPKTPKQPPQPFSKKTRKKMQKLAAPHKIRKPFTSADTTKEAKLIEGCGHLQEAKLIESHSDLQGPPPGYSSLVILAPPGFGYLQGPPEDSSLITLSTPPQQLSKKLRKKKKMQNLAPSHEIVRPTTSATSNENAKLIQGFGGSQGPVPGDSSIIISCCDGGGDGCANAVMPQANVARSIPNRGGHCSTMDPVVCQLCGKPSHTASDCYKRFNKGFKPQKPRWIKKGRTQSACSQPPWAPVVSVTHPSSTVFECVI